MRNGDDLSLRIWIEKTGLIDANNLRLAEAEQVRTGHSLEEVLVELGLISAAELLRVRAGAVGATLVGAQPPEVTRELLVRLDRRVAQSHGVLPLREDHDSVEVLAADPWNSELIDDVGFLLEREVSVVVADRDRVEALVRQHYEGKPDATRFPAVATPEEPKDETPLSDTEVEKLAGQPPVIQFVNRVLRQAIRERASDVHFEPFERELKIRCRVDGALRELAPPPRAWVRPVISRLKVLGNLNIAEHRVPQDGRVRLTLAGRAVDLRISTLPTQFGESVVLRVLDRAAVQLDLAQLTLPPPIERAVQAAIRQPHGIFIVTGPTGSGKTTTLYSCLKELNAPDVKILTVEDPVEYEIDGLMQVPVNHAAELTFARALRSFLRQDPDIVMVGEIRDLETAQIAIQAALTGHLVLSTLHTNDAPGAVTRLTDLGVEPFLLASTLEAVLAQRLVRRICRECRAPVEKGDAEWVRAGLPVEDLGGRTLYRGRGCPECQGSGYRGRVGVFEFLAVDEPMRESISAGAPLDQLRAQATARGLVPLRAAGLQAVFAGETTLEEILRQM